MRGTLRVVLSVGLLGLIALTAGCGGSSSSSASSPPHPTAARAAKARAKSGGLCQGVPHCASTPPTISVYPNPVANGKTLAIAVDYDPGTSCNVAYAYGSSSGGSLGSTTGGSLTTFKLTVNTNQTAGTAKANCNTGVVTANFTVTH